MLGLLLTPSHLTLPRPAAIAGVRGAAAVALAAYAEHLQPEIVETYEQLPRIFELLRDTEGHVVERACFVLSTFCEQLSDNDRGEEIVPYVSSIIETMVAILRSDCVHMHEVALSCITSAAATADESFAPHAPPLLEMMAACCARPRLPRRRYRAGARHRVRGHGACLHRPGGGHAIPTFVELALANYELTSWSCASTHTAMRERSARRTWPPCCPASFRTCSSLLRDDFEDTIQGDILATASVRGIAAPPRRSMTPMTREASIWAAVGRSAYTRPCSRKKKRQCRR